MPSPTGIESWLLLVIRWVHLMAATAWVGGSLFYLVVLRPALQRQSSDVAQRVGVTVGEGFRDVVQAASAVLVVSGVVLMFDRLAQGAGVAYAVVLAVKVLLGVAMFGLAWELGWAQRRPVPVKRRWPVAPASLLLALGLVVFFLALVLRQLAPAAS